jgi:hypothetical protein
MLVCPSICAARLIDQDEPTRTYVLNDKLDPQFNLEKILPFRLMILQPRKEISEPIIYYPNIDIRWSSFTFEKRDTPDPILNEDLKLTVDPKQKNSYNDILDLERTCENIEFADPVFVAIRIDRFEPIPI